MYSIYHAKIDYSLILYYFKLVKIINHKRIIIIHIKE